VANCVESYVGGEVTIWFEQEHVACRYCPLLETYSREMCRRTGEYIINSNTIGVYCPLNFKKEVENGN